MRFPSHFPSLITVVPAFLIAYVRAQSWNYSHYEYTTEEIPLWTAVVETEKNGYWDLGFGRSIKALVYELGGCSKGHPCAVGSGLPWGYPVGCNPDKCVARWLGDPWSNYNFLCQEMYDPDNTFLSDYLQGNATALTNEYFDYFDPTCILRYDPTTNLWTLENTGVAIVMKTQGFKLPAQTVIVSDIDTIDIYDAAAWPDIMQEANINFALNDGNLLKPTNTYAADRYPPSELTRTPDVLDPINVTLSQAYLDSLNLGISETWVMGTIAGLSSDKIGDCNHFKMPEFYAQVAGCSVWAEINTEFDTWVSTMSLGRKQSDDPDQTININIMVARTRCKCSKIEKTSTVVRPTATENVCISHLVNTKRYTCDDAGEYYCNEVTFTAWDRAGPDNGDGTLPCAARNTTKISHDIDIASVPAADWSSWPSAPVPVAAIPSATPYPSASPSTTPNPSPNPSPSPSPNTNS